MTPTARHLGLGLVILAIAGAIAITALADPGPSDAPRAARPQASQPRLEVRAKVTGLYPAPSSRSRCGSATSTRTGRLGFVKAKARDASPGCTGNIAEITPSARTRRSRVAWAAWSSSR